jgi:hypothetical protein
MSEGLSLSGWRRMRGQDAGKMPALPKEMDRLVEMAG